MMISRKQSVLAKFALVALILLTMAIYMPPFIRSFVGDDYIQFDYVKQFWLNPASILGVFNPTAVPWYYRPTQNIWFWLNRLILGWEPFGYYIILLWFHGLVIALMYRVARQFKLGYFAAFCTAVLLAIHSHWVDVITWISSVAIVMGAIFSLWAVSALLSYVQRPSTRQLSLVFLLTLLTFLTHEEAILLPPFLLLLLLMWRWQAQKQQTAVRKQKKGKQPRQSPISNLQSLITNKELITFVILFGLMVGYLIIQFTRPNPTVQVSDRTLAEWLAFLRWPEIAEFLLVTFFRFTFIVRILSLTGSTATFFVMGLLILLIIWFWQGNWVVRFGLLWLAGHLFFIYWALWSQLPTLYAGRHIYQAGIGLALAIGASIEMIFLNAKRQRRRGEKKWIKVRVNQVMIVVLVLLIGVSLHHLNETRKTQQVWLDNVAEEEIVKAQLYELFPDLSADTHIFSYRFPIAPDFTRTVAQVWYDVPLERPGGSLKHLAANNRADSDFIVLDYAEGQVYDLMPELREHKETIFLWANGADTSDMEVIANDDDDRRLALVQTATDGGWTGISFQVEAKENSELHTAVLARPNNAFRVQINDETVFELPSLSPDTSPLWVDVKIPVQDYAGEEIKISLLATAVADDETEVYWANPRLVID